MSRISLTSCTEELEEMHWRYREGHHSTNHLMAVFASENISENLNYTTYLEVKTR
jgi:hypothetical protein